MFRFLFMDKTLSLVRFLVIQQQVIQTVLRTLIMKRSVMFDSVGHRDFLLLVSLVKVSRVWPDSYLNEILDTNLLVDVHFVCIVVGLCSFKFILFRGQQLFVIVRAQ